MLNQANTIVLRFQDNMKFYRINQVDGECGEWIIAKNLYYAKKYYIESIICDPFMGAWDFKDYGLSSEWMKNFDKYINSTHSERSIDPFEEIYWMKAFYDENHSLYFLSDDFDVDDKEYSIDEALKITTKQFSDDYESYYFAKKPKI